MRPMQAGAAGASLGARPQSQQRAQATAGWRGTELGYFGVSVCRCRVLVTTRACLEGSLVEAFLWSAGLTVFLGS